MTIWTAGRIAMTEPDHYEVCYTINPWMKPAEWARDPAAAKIRARVQWEALAASLRETGAVLDVIPAEAGLPDMVFPANAAIILDGKALVARFRHPQRQGEEAGFRRFFDGLVERGVLREVADLPPGVIQEGAGDCLWDASRSLFWAGYGPRSDRASVEAIARCFGQKVVGLELATQDFYHLDTCFCVLPRGEILYFPGALSEESAARVAGMVPPDQRLEATAEEADSFCLNAVAIGRELIMSAPPPRLRKILEERGYHCRDVDLSCFTMSGGAAYCMTLRLDRTSGPSEQSTSAEATFLADRTSAS